MGEFKEMIEYELNLVFCRPIELLFWCLSFATFLAPPIRLLGLLFWISMIWLAERSIKDFNFILRITTYKNSQLDFPSFFSCKHTILSHLG